MRDHVNFLEIFEMVVNKYIRTQNDKTEYGNEIFLTRTEIHTINIIGLNPNINLTRIAKIQGITKGAVSQMIYKLRDKGLVIKTVSSNSDAELCIGLTDKGWIAYNEHKKIHQQINEVFYEKIDDFSDKEYEGVVNLLIEFGNYLDESVEPKKK